MLLTKTMAVSCEFRSVTMPQTITAANNKENLYFIHLFRANIAIPQLNSLKQPQFVLWSFWRKDI